VSRTGYDQYKEHKGVIWLLYEPLTTVGNCVILCAAAMVVRFPERVLSRLPCVIPMRHCADCTQLAGCTATCEGDGSAIHSHPLLTSITSSSHFLSSHYHHTFITFLYRPTIVLLSSHFYIVLQSSYFRHTWLCNLIVLYSCHEEIYLTDGSITSRACHGTWLGPIRMAWHPAPQPHQSGGLLGTC